MKNHITLFLLLLGSLSPLITGCSSAAKKTPDSVYVGVSGDTKIDGKSIAGDTDDLDEYGEVKVSDPLELLNRATFMLNHGLYAAVLRPISKGYEFIMPKFVRTGIHNAYENVRFPVRMVNHTLQGNFTRAGQETGKFVVNTVAGVGGLMQPAEHIPALANVPTADTGQTFSKWGVGHGLYLVLPFLGPSSLRDGVGLAGDFALNPVSWVTIVWGGYAWTIAIPSANTMRSMPNQLAQYDAAIENAVDPYLAARTSFIQYRAAMAER